MRNHRFLNSHIVNPANDRLCITVLDKPGPGGANHLYMISGFDTSTNPAKLIADDITGGNMDLPVAHMDAVPLIFQNGAIGDVGVNGITHEALLAILIDRLESFQTGPYKSNYNADALYHLQAAMHVLHRLQMVKGIEGTRAVGKESEAFKVREALEDLDKQERDDAAYDRSTEAQADAQKLKDHWESRLTEARTKTTEWPHDRSAETRPEPRPTDAEYAEYADRSTDGIAEAVETASAIHPAPKQFTPEEIEADPVLRYFYYEHLPEKLKSISTQFCLLASITIDSLPRNAERSTALRKLLEAKDAAVRAAL